MPPAVTGSTLVSVAACTPGIARTASSTRAVELLPLRFVVAAQRQVQLRRDHAVGHERGIDRAELAETAQEQPRADDQHQRQGDLDDGQRHARAALADRAADGFPRPLEDRDEIGARCAERRQDADRHRGERRDERGEAHDRQRPAPSSRPAPTRPPCGGRTAPPSTRRGTGRRHRRPTDSTAPSISSWRMIRAAAGAERRPHRDLALPRVGAGEQQVGDVRRRDHQDQPDDEQQQAERPTEIVHERGVAGAGRARADGPLGAVRDAFAACSVAVICACACVDRHAGPRAADERQPARLAAAEPIAAAVQR